jgi:hypothetical protein
MVNGPLLEMASAPPCADRRRRENAEAHERTLRDTAATAATCAFAQILGKFYFFELRENLRLILLNYGQKRPDPANVAFNAAC